MGNRYLENITPKLIHKHTKFHRLYPLKPTTCLGQNGVAVWEWILNQHRILMNSILTPVYVNKIITVILMADNVKCMISFYQLRSYELHG